MKTLMTLGLLLVSMAAVAQPQKKSVVIGSMTSKPNALLIVNPQHSNQGVLLPQLSTGQRLAITPSSPSEDGLIVFDTNANAYFYWSAGKWIRFRGDGNPRFFSIDPVDFQELKPDNNIRHTNMVVFQSDNSFVTASRNGHGEELVAPVSLPHGALIKELSIYYMDNDDDNIKVQLMRKSLAGASEQIVAWESSGASSGINNVSLTTFNGRERIDLENYTYRLIVIFDIDDDEDIDQPTEAKQRLYGARLKFEE